jgi:hypothetical protein
VRGKWQSSIPHLLEMMHTALIQDADWRTSYTVIGEWLAVVGGDPKVMHAR